MPNLEYDFNNCVDRINSDSAKWDGVLWKFGKPVLPMWVADMDFPAADCILSAIKNRLHHPVYGYPDHDESVQNIAATWLQKRHNWLPNADDILLIQGVVPALYAAVRAFSEPGERVIVMPPIYPPFMHAITENNRYLETVPLLSDVSGFYTIDFDRLESAMHHSKLLMLCSPHNPVGRTWTLAELLSMVDLAKKYDVRIVSDEIHADLSFEDYLHIPLPLIDDHSIFLGAASKSFNIAGIGGGIAWVGDPLLRKRFTEELGRSRNLGMHTFAKVASKAAWREGFEWQSALRRYFMENAQHIQQRLSANLPHIIYQIPQSSYLAWLDLRALGMTDTAIEQNLLQAGLGLNLGPSFGPGGSGYVRLNFGTPRKLLDQGLTLLENALS
ncbi:MalY/PatB family protein [Acidithiobacillus ferrianus]|uniref:MalY/PatB family protein n=1 Tax=Acidithiobacillus ferrianus TaxID=2678518 RepID=UPI0034E5200A